MQEFSSSLCPETVTMVMMMVILSSGSVTPSPGSLVLTTPCSPLLTRPLPSYAGVWCPEATTPMWTRDARHTVLIAMKIFEKRCNSGTYAPIK